MDVQKITYALSAIVESLYQITLIARDDFVNTKAITPLIRGVLKTECDTTTSIYPMTCLKEGLTYFNDVKRIEQHRAIEITKYLSGILSLTNVYLENNNVRQSLGEEIAKIKSKLSMQENKIQYVCRHLGEWYGKNITDAKIFSIQIFGNKDHLAKESNLIYIRALLASALRACVLWKQVGGTQMNFLFNKSQITICAKQMLDNLS